MRKKIIISTLVAFTITLFYLSNSYSDVIYDDFSFLSGSPVSGSLTMSDGNVVNIVTTNTEKFGSTAFRDLLNTDSALVTITFSNNVSEFHLDVAYVFPDEEWLTDFNIGMPDQLDGTLIESNGVVTTSGSDDNGYGRLSWFGLNTNAISFIIGNSTTYSTPLPPAVAVTQFGASTITAEPVPSMNIINLIIITGVIALLGILTIQKRGAVR